MKIFSKTISIIGKFSCTALSLPLLGISLTRTHARTHTLAHWHLSLTNTHPRTLHLSISNAYTHLRITLSLSHTHGYIHTLTNTKAHTQLPAFSLYGLAKREEEGNVNGALKEMTCHHHHAREHWTGEVSAYDWVPVFPVFNRLLVFWKNKFVLIKTTHSSGNSFVACNARYA